MDRLDIPIREQKRTSLSIPESLRDRLTVLTRPFYGSRSEFFRKLYYDIVRYTNEHSPETLCEKFARHWAQLSTQDKEPPSTYVNINYSIPPNDYKKVTRTLNTFRSPFLRYAIKLFVENAEKIGDEFIATVLSPSTKLEDYLVIFKTEGDKDK